MAGYYCLTPFRVTYISLAELTPKLTPLIVTGVPSGPLAGVKVVILGKGGISLNVLVSSPVPFFKFRPMGPFCASSGTITCSWAAVRFLIATGSKAEAPLKSTLEVPAKKSARTIPVPVMVTVSQ